MDRATDTLFGSEAKKAHRLDFYQHGRDRITSPLRRRTDGTFEEIDWDTAISEIATRLATIRDEHGGESIFYYGGGGQGNHLPGAYSAAMRRALNSRYKSSALAQEKTGEMWVSGHMFGAFTRGDFKHCEVAMFIGKNPWFSHGVPRARVTLKEIAKDPKRTMIVIDPRKSKTAEMADIHLQVKPGKDAWLLSAMAAILLQEDLIDHGWIAEHCDGIEPVVAALNAVSISGNCKIAGVTEDLVRRAARRVASAKSVASYEDLGVQMNRHSTLVSYLHRFLWVLTGNLAKVGAQYSPTPMVSLAGSAGRGQPKDRRSPVADARIIAGLVPCNVIAEEILTDHPKRYRAMIVESGNPAHSLADSQRVREAA